MKTMRLRFIVLAIVCVIFIIYLITGLIVGGIANSECHYQCKKERALTFELFPQGGLTINNDICVCYGKNWIHTFELGDLKGGYNE